MFCFGVFEGGFGGAVVLFLRFYLFIKRVLGVLRHPSITLSRLLLLLSPSHRLPLLSHKPRPPLPIRPIVCFCLPAKGGFISSKNLRA